MDAMQLELSNFQPLAATEAVKQEVQHLSGRGRFPAHNQSQASAYYWRRH
jgi:hypothetical protein